MAQLKPGDRGEAVVALQEALTCHGYGAGDADGIFGPATQSAVIGFQQSKGLTADGIAGSDTLRALGLETPPPASRIPCITVAMASRIVPGAPVANIERHLPFVLNALIGPQLADKAMILMALATIRVETGSFQPISEMKSCYNTSECGPDFDLYDRRTDLGNQGPPDGARFKGRGFIQLTGRTNYAYHGAAIGLGDQLLTNPDLANDPDIAARLLASFLKSQENRIRTALRAGDLTTARQAVNGGCHGLEAFTQSYEIGNEVLPDAFVIA